MLFVGSVSSLAPDLRVKYLLRYLAPHVLSAVARRYRDFASSEDAVQEALIAAASQWPRSGVPNNLVGWLVQVAQRRMVDQVRSEISRRNREAAVLEESAIATPGPDAENHISRRDRQHAVPLRIAVFDRIATSPSCRCVRP